MTAASYAKRLADETGAAIERLSLVQVIAGATLFLLVYWGFKDPLAKIAVQLALLAVVLRPVLLENRVLWLSLSVVNTVALVNGWVAADNHKYLTVYWVYVVTLAVWVSDRKLAESILTWHGRFFLIFVFSAAALQKTISPTYMSGEMFEMRLLIDERFKAFGHLLGLDRSVSDTAFDLSAQLRNPMTEFEGNAVALPATDHVRTLGLVITWYDLIIQFAIGLIFIPARAITDRIGHFLLLFFIFTTYLPAPVFGFGWLLAIYGLSLSWKRYPAFNIAYLVSFVAILLYQLPWRAWVLTW
ncbi:MAG: hypothetical protein ACR2OL_01065 [Anderseniella sp.]